MPELPDLDNILHSGQLAAGKYTKDFEDILTNYFQHRSILATSTFNTAISVAISTLDLKYGDEVIASPMACLASTQPYATAGLRIRWADIDPETGTLSPESVRSRINSNTKAIIHNHFCGYPGYIDEINAVGKEYGIAVIDDGIECFGSRYKGRLIGNCGTDVTVFSFNPVRMLTTIDGGAVMFDNAELLKKATLVRDCGIDRSIFRDDLGEISSECDINVQGYSATLSNVNSYIGIQQFENLEKRIKTQRKNAKKWAERLKDYGDYKPLQSVNGEPNYWVYGILANNKRSCIKKFRECGFYASGVHINNNIYSIFGKEETLPGVKKFYDSFVALPCGWWVDEEMI
ncbi:DegT/DnrJ/EryC1/StrS family aminotransferase [Pseudobutyrivibrio xylanivorans]|nr:aminotransferase class V-fold PLP-dependent enzyme [Pseudobutyrivibrio xylanivorans]